MPTLKLVNAITIHNVEFGCANKDNTAFFHAISGGFGKLRRSG